MGCVIVAGGGDGDWGLDEDDGDSEVKESVGSGSNCWGASSVDDELSGGVVETWWTVTEGETQTAEESVVDEVEETDRLENGKMLSTNQACLDT